MNWKIQEKGFREGQISKLGNRLLCGNGYLGIRGTLEEYEKEQMPAINLAGIYDQVGSGWREPLNAPNGLYTYIVVDGKEYRLPETEPLEHEASLDFRCGIFSRKTSWRTDRGTVTVESERFAGKDEIHRICMRYTVTADFHAEVDVVTGIDGDVWDIHGPHYDTLQFSQERDILLVKGTTHEKRDTVTVMELALPDFPCEEKPDLGEKKQLRRISFVTECQKPYRIEKAVTVFTSQDGGWNQEKGLELLRRFQQSGYEEIKAAHSKCWEEKWEASQVEIRGDEEAMKALNYSIYHLLSIAPTHAENMSIPARGLSGQTYKGAIFWDTEMFMLDFFLFTDPTVAKSLMKYRVDTLQGALDKARSYGYEGAFYAWESQEGGFDACTDYNVTDVFTGRPQRTYFRDKQYHISAAVVYGIMRYVELTGDRSLLYEGGLRVIIECARFYYSLLLKKVSGTRYEIHDVIGPDEYHERVNNNAYTNRMAKFTLESAVKLLEALDEEPSEFREQIRREYPVEELVHIFRDSADSMYMQEPGADGLIPQFDGYFKLEDATLEEVRGRLLHEKEYWGGAYGVAAETKVIKQADVVTMLNLFSQEYGPEILKKNWEYYEPRTEHGSSLSSCMYAMLACKCGMPRQAYPFFMDSARADLKDGGKEWAGLVYIGGTHPAAAGGAYMTAVEGFGGISVENGELKVKAALPQGWEEMRFCICCQGQRYRVTVREEGAELTPA